MDVRRIAKVGKAEANGGKICLPNDSEDWIASVHCLALEFDDVAVGIDDVDLRVARDVLRLPTLMRSWIIRNGGAHRAEHKPVVLNRRERRPNSVFRPLDASCARGNGVRNSWEWERTRRITP